MKLSESFKSVIGAIAPVIGTALGGPLGGAALSTISQTLLGESTQDIALIEQAVKTATPEQLAALKKVDNDFEIRMQELGINLEQMRFDDIASARAREVQVKDKIPAILAILLTLGFFGILAYMFHSPSERYSEALMVMLGALGTGFLQVLNYYFGSSAGSAKKNELLAGLRS